MNILYPNNTQNQHQTRAGTRCGRKKLLGNSIQSFADSSLPSDSCWSQAIKENSPPRKLSMRTRSRGTGNLIRKYCILVAPECRRWQYSLSRGQCAAGGKTRRAQHRHVAGGGESVLWPPASSFYEIIIITANTESAVRGGENILKSFFYVLSSQGFIFTTTDTTAVIQRLWRFNIFEHSSTD